MSDDDTSGSEDATGGSGPGLDRHRIDDSIYQGFNPGPQMWGPGPDGLPTPEVKNHLPLAPPLAPETFVCIADESEFVIRSKRWGQVVARFKPELAKRAENGQHFVAIEDAIRSGAPWQAIFQAVDARTRRVRVEPLRPQCRYFAQQMVDFQDNVDHVMLERMCTARRDDESYFVGLRDTQVHACGLREPRDRVSEARIDTMNRTKIILGRERMRETGEKFDVDARLNAEATRAEGEGLSSSGIFADKR